MKINFLGASGEVTGSNYLVELDGGFRILVDCGLFQGNRFAEGKNYEEFQFDSSSVHALLLTHAHLDHTGRLPKLVADGFRGKIYTTVASSELAQIVLEDAAGLMLEEAQEENHEPLYLMEDLSNLIPLFERVDYHREFEIGPGVRVTYIDAGHILGSASIKLEHGGKSIIFSGDLGNPPVPILKPTEYFDSANGLVIESTYGGRVHEPPEERTALLTQAIKDIISSNGTLMIPAFAVERTQELLYEINHLIENKIILEIPVFLDSPMAIKTTNVFRHSQKYFNNKDKVQSQQEDLFSFPGLTLTQSVQLSKEINEVTTAKIIIAGSGMMNGGRILHHAKRYLSDANSMLLIVGYQVEGSLGRRLLDGEKKVKIHRQDVSVRARIKAIGAYSAHADQPKLLKYIEVLSPRPQKIFITHGEPAESQALAQKIKDQFDIDSVIPKFNDWAEF